MKKYFILAAAACVTLASCVKNEAGPALEQGDLITFASPVVAPATKAQVKYEAGPFNVFAYYSEATSYTGANAAAYIKDRTVSLIDNVWTTSNPYYWPKNGTLTFVAYSPASAAVAPQDGTAPLTVASTNGSTNLVLDYTVPTAATDQIDVLYSDWAKDQKKENYVTLNQTLGGWKGVDIAFHHALTAVNFTVKGSEDAVNAFKIKGITLGALSNKETLTVDLNNNATWTEAATSTVTYTILAEAADAENSTALTTAGSIKNSFYLIPQAVKDAKITIKYYVTSDEGWIPQTTSIYLKDAEANDAPLTKWNIGTKYNYTIEFTADAITFAPVVEADWDEKNVAFDKI